jgi:hypothetical protein
METESGAFRTLRETLPSAPPQALSTSAQSHLPTCPDEVATRRAAILLASYRKGDAENPEIYTAAVASVLTCYPLPVAYRVTDPRSGLPGRSQWLPTVAEVRAACEAEMAPSRAAAARDRRRRETDAVLQALAEPLSHDRSAAMARIQGAYPQLFPTHKAQPMLLAAEDRLREYGRQPISPLSDEAKALLAKETPND